MTTHDNFARIFEEYLAHQEFPREPANLYAPIAYALEGGGKRLRPRLLLVCYSLFGDDVSVALPAAAAVEVFHTFTLMQDDIMDNSSMRRGRASAHCRWGVNPAMLAGDVMMTYSYKLLEKLPIHQLPVVLSTFNHFSVQVFEGQQYDMDFEEEDEVDLDRYMEMIRLKTAALLACAAKMGAIIGGASGADCDVIERFATHLGLAFQLQDDLLDTYGDSAILGKEVGGDIMEKKKTFLLINALNLASPVGQRELLRLMDRTDISREEMLSGVRAVFDSLAIRELTIEAISAQFTLALEALGELSIPENRVAPLRDLAMKLIGRNK